MGRSWGLWVDRLRESWVKELDGWVQQQIGDSAWRLGNGQGRLQSEVARGRKGIIREQRVMGGETGANWYIVEGVCILWNWVVKRIRSDVVEVRVLCWEVKVEGVNGWQRKGIRCGCGDIRRTFGVVAEGCRVLPDPGFVSGVEVLVVVVGSVQVISGAGCTVLAWRYDLRGNGQEGGEQRQKQLQMEPRDLLTLVTCRRLQFNFTSFHISVLKTSSQQVTPEQRYGAMYLHYLHCSLNNILVI